MTTDKIQEKEDLPKKSPLVCSQSSIKEDQGEAQMSATVED
jgi:hypothetical protein